MEMTEKELQMLCDVASEKLMLAYQGCDGAAYVLWLNIVCKLAAKKGETDGCKV